MIAHLLSKLLRRRTLAEQAARDGDEEAARLRDEAFAASGQNRFPEAEALLERAISLAARRPELHEALGSVRLRAGDFERALAAYAAALRLAPGFPVALLAQWGAATARARLDRAGRGAGIAETSGSIGNRLVSIVICSNTRAKFEKVMVNFRERLGPVPHEVIGIHDARSLSEGYNRGVVRSRGDIVVFSHDDIRIVSPDFAAKLFASLAQCDLVGVAGTTLLRSAAWGRSGWPHLAGQVGHTLPDGRRLVVLYGLQDRLVLGAQAFDGLFFAVRREVLERVRFDESTFDGWHFYDVDFTFSAFLAGLRLGIRTDLLVWHDSTGSFDERWEYYAQRFLSKHSSDLLGDGGVKPQIVGVEVSTDEEWIAVTRHLFD
jgi:hypothetical protein